LVRLVFPAIFRVDVDLPMTRIGTNYGGWWVPSNFLDDLSVCYLAGVGTDISFDLGVVERFGSQVWSIDPTPESVTWMAKQDLPPQMRFLAIGLAGSNQKLRFYAPADPTHVSHSVANLQRTDRYFEAECQTVATLMGSLGHERIDLLKLDIEGAQHDVIDSLLRDNVFPRVLCVEMDQPEPVAVSRRSVARLRAAGYGIAKVEDFNLTLVRVQHRVPPE